MNLKQRFKRWIENKAVAILENRGYAFDRRQVYSPYFERGPVVKFEEYIVSVAINQIDRRNLDFAPMVRSKLARDIANLIIGNIEIEIRQPSDPFGNEVHHGKIWIGTVKR